MKEIAIHFIISYIAKKFEYEIFIDLIPNYKDDFRYLEYNNGNQEC